MIQDAAHRPADFALAAALRMAATSPAPMLLVRADTGEATLNQACHALLDRAAAPVDAWSPLASMFPEAVALTATVRAIVDAGLAATTVALVLREPAQVALSALYREDGAIAGVLGVVQVLPAQADQAEHERALAAGEARFRAITNAMPQMVWSTLPDGFHDYYSDQWYAFTGVPPGSTDGVAWNDMFHPDDQAAAWARWRHSLATGEPYEIEYRLRHRSGAYRWVLGRALPVRGEDGVIQRWMGTCTDIHEHKLTADALRDADVRKDEFLAMLGHELRNPLAPISSAAALLPLAKGDPVRVEHIGRVIARQAAHMAGLVDDLLDVSRVTRGTISLDRQTVDVRLLVDEAVEQVRPLVDARSHTLDIACQGPGGQVVGDAKRLVQVISNLLSNAARYTPPGGQIAVSIASTHDTVRIAVRDNGIGMSPDLIAGAFELFRQGTRTPDRSQGGLGIGPALVNRLVQLHGGRVEASSGGEGMGSEVAVTLPLHGA
ncbi:ATP-binding protein [Massilia aurea]|uniref:PAS domain-containing sensor histidine kinase n=1 Tax=Massilia aurea TaxID=373040 RepID=UPI003461F3BD